MNEGGREGGRVCRREGGKRDEGGKGSSTMESGNVWKVRQIQF